MAFAAPDLRGPPAFPLVTVCQDPHGPHEKWVPGFPYRQLVHPFRRIRRAGKFSRRGAEQHGDARAAAAAVIAGKGQGVDEHVVGAFIDLGSGCRGAGRATAAW